MAPWTCCQEEHLDEVKHCPTCNARKPSWTIRHEVTRRFVVGRRRGKKLAPPVPVELQFLYHVEGEEPHGLEGVEVVVGKALVETAPGPTPESGTVVVPFTRAGTHEIKLKLPEPFNEEWLTCDPRSFATATNPAGPTATSVM